MRWRWRSLFWTAGGHEMLRWSPPMFTAAHWCRAGSQGNLAGCLAMALAHLFCAMLAELKNRLGIFWEDFSLGAPINTRRQFVWPAAGMVDWRCDSMGRHCRAQRLRAWSAR